MANIQKWQLLSAEDVSPSPWFPIEKRSYQLPNGKIVDDFTVTTLADVAMILAITKDRQVVVVRQYKPGIDEITLEFPAGRMEQSHESIEDTAIHELEEETGILVEKSRLMLLCVTAPFVTKATEKIYCYLATDVEFNSSQNLDTNEDIEVETYSFDEFEQLIYEYSPIASVTLTTWCLAKRKFPEIFMKK